MDVMKAIIKVRMVTGTCHHADFNYGLYDVHPVCLNRVQDWMGKPNLERHYMTMVLV